MQLKNLKIGTQLLLGFSIILFLVIALGILSRRQTEKIHQQTELIYEHPLQVRRAIGVLTTNIQQMRLGTRDLMLAINEIEQQAAMESIEISASNAQRQFEIIFNLYSGPRTDIENAYQAFITWETKRKVNNTLALNKNHSLIKENVATTGTIGMLREDLLQKINVIDEYTKNRGETLYRHSFQLKETLNKNLYVFIAIIVLITLLIYFQLLHHIRKPLVMLTKITRRFDEGELSARCSYISKNELGMLSEAFNTLAENIEITSILNTQTDLLSDMLLIEDDPKRFFQITMQILMEDTNSQMAAVYLLSEDKKYFEHFESIGLDENAKRPFLANEFEGEIGLAIATKKIQHLKNIPDSTRFVFKATTGKFIPREILTIPIFLGHDIFAVISIASLYQYTNLAIQLINKMHLTYCARIDKILTYQKLRSFSETLAVQNRELEAQKLELTSQSTELSVQNRELEVQKEQLNEANKLKTSFLSNMSHELRTPLNSIIALSGVLNRHLKEEIPKEEYSYLEVIERNGKNLLNLINNILDISRIESGYEEIELSSINLCDCVNDVVVMIQPQAFIKKIELINSTGNCEIQVQSDSEKIIHILQNMIGNAVKFTEKGEVTVSTSLLDEHVIVTVTDSGIGISEEHLPHIFDEFKQADGSTSRSYGGTGLGLAIAKKYANLLGGFITVKSQKGIGSEFILKLPLVYSDIYREETTTYTHEKTLFSDTIDSSLAVIPKTILIIEDSEPAVIQLRDILEESGYHILVAENGKEGIKVMAKNNPDAIILDLMMPEVDGFALLEMIRNNESTALIPVLILTAKHITKDELKFLKKNNIYQLIQKGDVNKAKLLNTVKGMVSSINTGHHNEQ